MKQWVAIVGVWVSWIWATDTSMAAIVFDDPVNVSVSSGRSFDPSLAVGDDGAVYAAWDDDSSLPRDVMVAKSTDEGRQFTPPLNISNNSGVSAFPSIAVTGTSRLYVVWHDNTSGNSEILFSRSLDGGTTFAFPLNISNNTGGSSFPSIAADPSGTIYVVWQDTTGSASTELFFAKSTNGGVTFTNPVNLSNTSAASTNPAVAVDPTGMIAVVWQERVGGNNEILFIRSLDGGATFSAPLNVSNTAGNSAAPDITLDGGGGVFTAWQEASEIFVVHSTDWGVTFSSGVNITNNSGKSLLPELAVEADGILHAAWMDNTPGNYDTLYSQSTDGGQSFLAPVNVSNNESGSLVAAIAVDMTGAVYVAWDDSGVSNYEILVSRGEESGPAILSLGATPDPFSPDGDAVADTTTVTASFTETLLWSLTITDSLGSLIRSFEGSGTSFTVIWDGTDEAGTTVPDGIYTLTVEGRTTEGTFAQPATGEVSVDTTPQGARPPVVSNFGASPDRLSPDGDGRQETTTISATFDQSTVWTINIRNSAGATVRTITGSGATLGQTWDGKNSTGAAVPDGTYTIVLEASNIFGESAAPVSTQVIVDTVDPSFSNLTVGPNPFNPPGETVAFSLSISEEALVTIHIFDSAGAVVRELFRSFLPAGTVSTSWDGRNGSGQLVNNGRYTYKLWVRDNASNRATPYPAQGTITVE